MDFIYFLVLIGVLIFIHEFGHFFFAKLFGVRVDRFALGMGPVVPFLSFTKGETEYAICAFPIGGYVKMFGMQPEELYDEYGDPYPEEEVQRAFVRKPIWQRFIIVLAGPMMNLIFPVLVYYAFALGTAALPPAQVGQVFTDNPAAQAVPLTAGAPKGLQAGDTIVSINGEPLRYWRDLTGHVRGAIGQELKVRVRRGDKELDYKLTPASYTETDRLGLMRETYGLIGVSVASYGPVLGIQDREGPAAKAGLRSFDRVVSVDGAAVKRFVDLQEAVRTSGGKPLKLAVARPQALGDFLGGGMNVSAPVVDVTVQPVQRDGVWALGAEPAEMFLADVAPESPAAEAGLRVGDKLLSVANCEGEGDALTCGQAKPYNNMQPLKIAIQQRFWEQMQADTDVRADTIKLAFKVAYARDGQRAETTYRPVVRMIPNSFNEPTPEIWFGIDTVETYAMPDPISVPWGDRFAIGLEKGVSQTWRFTQMMFNGIVHLIQGKVSTDTVGGPIMIFDIASKAGNAGWEAFLRTMAIISINLGLVNLLPIPLLDGGHLMLFSIEAIKRKELNARTRQVAYYVGLGMIVFLMLLAFKNDIERYWERFADWFNA